jgi:hypothetical protein
MTQLNSLEAMGFALPSPAYLGGALMFGVIGFAAWRYGRKTDAQRVKWTGVALMFFPYFVDETWLLYALGTALCISLFFSRR